MPDITTLRNTYFVNSADEDLPSEPVPATYGGCLITPLIGPDSFFSEFERRIHSIGVSDLGGEEGDHFIYLANWSLGLGGANPFTLDGVSGNNRLIDVLIAKAQAGVDVRVLPWVSTTVMCGVTGTIAQLLGGSGVRGIRNHNLMTLESVRLLREEPELRYNACLNINHHPNGSAHLKMAIVYDGATCVGFTGGLDFIQSRYGWRDVQAKIEGPVVQDLYDYFREIWNELISRRPIEFDVDGNVIYSHLQGEGADDRPPTVIARDFSSTPSVVGTHHVQSLRTVPLNPAILGAPMLPTAPQGIFNIRTALRKAIRAAQTYIYMEDQYFWSREIMSWINEAVRTHHNLKVILLSHGFGTYAQYAIVNYLFHNPHPNLPDLNPSERARIAIFRLARAPDGTTYPCADYNIVHSKTTLIDDQWAIIGSANCTQRSLYTDFEHAISMLDECDSLVRQYRIDLWYEYFCGTEIEDLQQALNAWDCDTFLPTHLVRYSPQEDASLSALDATRYEYADADSRSWRSLL
jgi:phosphatidylserine/phosphatidylglycerophosphate/cardiolipin synthase-like enzyme